MHLLIEHSNLFTTSTRYTNKWKSTSKPQTKLLESIDRIFRSSNTLPTLEIFSNYIHPTINYPWYNRRGIELDIYIPSLSLAFEYHGEYHQKDQYKTNSLEIRKLKDTTKRKFCKENDIHLIEVNWGEWDGSDESLKGMILQQRPELRGNIICSTSAYTSNRLFTSVSPSTTATIPSNSSASISFNRLYSTNNIPRNPSSTSIRSSSQRLKNIPLSLKNESNAKREKREESKRNQQNAKIPEPTYKPRKSPIDFIHALGKHFKIQSLDDWYKVSYTEAIKVKTVKTVLRVFYNGSLRYLLQIGYSN